MNEILEYTRDGYEISTERERLDLDVVHGYLTRSYWSPGVPRHVVERAVANSLCFGLYHEGAQVGFARVVTDYARFAYLCDVFVLKPHRGGGLGKWLVECAVDCPLTKGIRRMTLGTRDAHGLYEQYGFKRAHGESGSMSRMWEMDWYRPDMVEE